MMPTIPVEFLDRTSRHPDRIAMTHYAASGEVTPMSWKDWRDSSLAFAAALAESAARDTGAVAILAANNFVWPVADLGTILSGRTSVGIYPTSSSVQIEKMLADSAAGVLVTDDPAQLAVVLEMKERLPGLRVIVASCATSDPRVIAWNEWLEIGRQAKLARPGLAESLIATALDIDRDDPAIIIYTSGSTGEPKGAVLSHGCVSASARCIAETLGLVESDTTLSFLPFSHAAERITGLYTRIHRGMGTALIEDAASLWDVARSFRPTIFGGLPRYYEKLHRLAAAEGRTAMEILGGRVRLATSGGAALPVPISEGLAGSGITVLGAYGLSEHLCVAFNRPGDATFDTSGTAMPGTEIRIAADGEILIRRSELTFSGYHNLPEATSAAFTGDGEWLCTGDLGAVDAAGRLRITGRKKELLALSNGKMVAPLPIEAQLAAHPLISHAVLHAEGQKFVSALIALRPESLEAWARNEGIDSLHEDLASHPRVTDEIQRAVDAVNATLSRAESIKRFVTIGRELSVAASELTPTHKVRRNAVIAKFSAELEALYT